MLRENIMLFAGMALKNERKISPASLQRFIFRREEVGKALPIEDIKSSLDLLVTAGFLEVCDTISGLPIYRKPECLYTNTDA